MNETPEHNNNIWLSLEQLIKYVKGNLLGVKKQEVEDKITASALLSDAAEGIKASSQPEKLQSIVDGLNRQIRLKSGAGAISTPLEATTELSGSTSTRQTLSGKALLSIAASLVVLVAAGAAVWWSVSKTPDGLSDSKVLAEKEEQLAPNSFFGNSEPKLKDSASDTTRIAANGLFSSQDTTPVPEPSEDLLIALNNSENRFYQGDAESDDLLLKREKSYEDEKTRYQKDNTSFDSQGKMLVAETATPRGNEVTQLEEETELSTNSVNNEEQKELNSPVSNSYSTENIPTRDTKSISTESIGAYSDQGSKKKDSNNDAADYQAAINLLNAGNNEEAKAAFEELSSRKGSIYQDDAYWNLAQIYLKEGDDKEAKKSLKKIKSSDKYGTRAKEELDKL